MEWPIFFRDNLLMGSSNSAIGICTLWTSRDVVAKSVPSDSYAVCGNLYTVQGINPMLKNILANPKIQNIILCGADLMKSGDALINFIDNGIDHERKIIGSYGYIDADIEDSLVEKLRKNLKVTDMRGRENEIPGLVKELPKDPAPFMEPVFITTSEETPPLTESDETSYRVDGKTVRETWLKMLDIIMKFGKEKPTEYNIKQKEILNMTAVVDDDADDDEKLKSYYKTFFSKDVPFGVTYTYGSRLYGYDLGDGKFFDQVSYIIERLKLNPATRRAFVSLWNVGKDSDANNRDPPCIVSLCFNIRDDKLHETAVIRSNDIFGAWMFNASALRRLQKEIASRLGIGVGVLTTISISAHIYENNWKEANDILDMEYHGKFVPFRQDSNGYFVIDVKDGEIIIEHRVNDGRRSNYVFRGKKAQALYRQILHENLVTKPDHAAYIGHELARAEICLKGNKIFVQDEA